MPKLHLKNKFCGLLEHLKRREKKQQNYQLNMKNWQQILTSCQVDQGNVEEKKDEKEVVEEEMDKERTSKSGWDFKLGGLPKKKDCLIDEYKLLCAENLEELLTKNKQSQQINEEDEESAPPW
ncbi:unnamed protein product [Meloidogyne enterolobii]|uniref:Uncharacterized protein n=1 Tax=Meloidogyne enterolobii TaxID=390850 RepID=A0ACB0ZSW0_MELEN